MDFKSWAIENHKEIYNEYLKSLGSVRESVILISILDNISKEIPRNNLNREYKNLPPAQQASSDIPYYTGHLNTILQNNTRDIFYGYLFSIDNSNLWPGNKNTAEVIDSGSYYWGGRTRITLFLPKFTTMEESI